MNEDLKTFMILTGGIAVALLGARLIMYATAKKSAEAWDYVPEGPEDVPLTDRRVALLGDSLSGGLTYRKELQGLLGGSSLVSAFSYPGKETGVVKSHVQEVIAWSPTDVILLAGVNDLANGKGVNYVIGNLNDMYVSLIGAGIRVVGVALTPWGGHPKGTLKQPQTREVNDWILFMSPVHATVDTSGLGDSAGYAYKDFVGTDGLHLTISGQREFAQEVYLQGFCP